MSTHRILAVDDSASMRQMVAFALTSAGFDVVEAEDGMVALEKAKKERFSAVVADVNMPNMDGITLIRHLRQLPDYRFTPLLQIMSSPACSKALINAAASANSSMHWQSLRSSSPGPAGHEPPPQLL